MTQPKPDTGAAQPEALARAYVPAEFEHAIYERWLAADVFAPDGAGSTADEALPPFVIIQPPPNVTGSLHLGHAQRTTVEDLMIRHARMLGRPTLFLPGLDHASIAAQFVLDGILAKEGESRATLGRERYLERMREFVDATREVILDQQRRRRRQLRLGPAAVHDGRGQRAGRARVAFERLYRDGLAYRTEALVNWCPGCETSVSDLEVHPDARDRDAVDRPLPPPRRGDRPAGPGRHRDGRHDPARDDPRRHRRRRAPRRPALRGARRPPRPDPVRRARRAGHRRRRGRPGVRHRRREDHARPRPRRLRDRASGTAWRCPTILDDEARVANTGTPLRRPRPLRGPHGGSSRTSRRAATSPGEQPHEMVIGRCQRSDDVVEPRLKTQWFVRTGPLAAAALEATRGGETTILPASGSRRPGSTG